MKLTAAGKRLRDHENRRTPVKCAFQVCLETAIMSCSIIHKFPRLLAQSYRSVPAEHISMTSGLPRPLQLHQTRWMLMIWLSQSVCDVRIPSHTFAVFHGISVRPSGLFPSDLNRPVGSLTEGTFAFPSARQTKSFKLWWRADRPVPPSLHESPWSPLASVTTPHGHWCCHLLSWLKPHRPEESLLPTSYIHTYMHTYKFI